MNTTPQLRKRIRRRQSRSAVRRLAARLGSFMRRRTTPQIPLAPFEDT